MNSRDKIVSPAFLREMIDSVRGRGKDVVLANGIFDLVHVGHVRYLEAARREGDVLVVAINSDASARQLKGPGRPILGEAARAELIAAVGAVDAVVVFHELNVERLLEFLRPDVHAKGTDYAPNTVPERDTAARLGIRVAIVGDPKKHSTSDLFSRIRSAATHRS